MKNVQWNTINKKQNGLEKTRNEKIIETDINHTK